MSEFQHQGALFEWARMPSTLAKHPELDLLESSLNGVKLTARQAAGAKYTGMLKGSHDVTLKVARGGFHGLSIEMKRPAETGKPKGRVSPEQFWYGERLKTEGWDVRYCYGWLEAKNVIEEYLS